MKHFLPCLLLSLFTLPLFSQSIKFFDETDHGFFIKKTADENLIAAFYGYVYKMNNAGDIIWELALDPWDYANYENIFEMADGSFRCFYKNIMLHISSDGFIISSITFPLDQIVGVCDIGTGFWISIEHGTSIIQIKTDYDGGIEFSNSEGSFYTFQCTVAYTGGVITCLRRGESIIGSLITSVTQYDISGTKLPDSIYTGGYGYIDCFDTDQFIIGNQDFGTGGENLSFYDYDGLNLISTLAIPPVYDYINDSLSHVITGSSGNYFMAIKSYEYATMHTSYSLAYLDHSGVPYYYGPDFLVTGEGESYDVNSFIRVEENEFAFIGTHDLGATRRGFLLLTDSTGALLQMLETGKIYYDENGNMTYDTGELEFPNTFVETTPGEFLSVSDSSGNYKLNIFSEGIYSSNCVLPEYWDLCDPISYSEELTPLTSGDTIENLDYRLDYTTPVTELSVTMHTSSMSIGSNTQLNVTINNFGNQTVDYGTLNLYHSHLQVLLWTEPAYSYYSDTIITFEFSDLKPFESRTFNAYLFNDSTYYDPDADTLAYFRTELGAIPDDINPANNSDSATVEVGSPYDPNSKSAKPEGSGPGGAIPATTEWLQYDIEFQNTGTGPAINVNIEDTIDTNFDVTSLQMLSASFPYTMEIKSPNLIIWHFNNIYLPDSGSDFDGSMGFLQYRIKIIGGTSPGTELKNAAAIYFDFNPAILTNTTINTLDTAQSNIEVENMPDALHIVPNPASESFAVYSETDPDPDGILTIENISGQIIFSKSLNGTNYPIFISAEKFPEGIYFLSIINNKNHFEERAKLVIAR